MEHCKVVLVDDDQDDLVFLKYALEQTGRVVIVAACCDYQELMTILDTQPLPDLIVSDLFMPGKNGIEVCRQLQQNVAYSNIPVVLLTGSKPTNATAQAAAEYGVKAILVKPNDLGHYTEVTSQLVNICMGLEPVL